MAKQNNSSRNRGFLPLLVILLPLTVTVPACTGKRPVYIPPEYSSPAPPRQETHSAPPAPAVQPPPAAPGPILNRQSQFSKADLPAGPPGVPPAQPPSAPPAPAQQPTHVEKKQEKSPQYLASMQLVNEARPPLNRGKPDLAIPKLERAIQVDVQNGEAFLLLARAWRQKGEKKKALEFAKKAEILYQDEPARLKEVLLFESELFKEMGDNAKAAQYRKKAAGLR